MVSGISLTKIKNAMKQLLTIYSNDPKNFMTENDVVLRAYQLLCDEGVASQSIHSELRPYRPGQRDIEVLTKDDWKQGVANRGTRIDLSIVDINHWKDAYCKAPKTRSGIPSFWRFLLFPVEGFQAAFEFKARVRGNHPRILHDAEVLKRLKEENPKCEVFLVILDHAASEQTLQRLDDQLEPYREDSLHIYQSRSSDYDVSDCQQ